MPSDAVVVALGGASALSICMAFQEMDQSACQTDHQMVGTRDECPSHPEIINKTFRVTDSQVRSSTFLATYCTVKSMRMKSSLSDPITRVLTLI
jgi:hypothetical protein